MSPRPLILAALALALALPTSASADFTPFAGSPLEVGSLPFAVGVGDFNADGRRDLAVPLEGDDKVAVFERQADGSYTLMENVEAGDGPISVAVADFNGDMRADIAAANFNGGTVAIFLRLPGGGFVEESGSPVSLGGLASSVATADLNADGRPDLVATGQAAGNVKVLLRDAGGEFTEAPGSPYAVGTYPHEVRIADFDGANGPDLAVTNQQSGDVTVLLRQPGGEYAEEANSPYTVGTTPLGLATADFDGDGDTDLATANTGSDNVSVLLRQPGGFAPETAVPAGDAPYGLVAADFNGDGRPDLAVGNENSSTVTVHLRSVAGGFAPGLGSPIPGVYAPTRLAAADFDGDGRIDLAVPNHGSTTVTLLRNEPPPPVVTPTPTPAPPQGDPPVNLERPTIQSTPSRRRYLCREGTWANLPPNPVFKYQWFRAYSLGAHVLVGNSAVYEVPEAYVGYTFYCVVTVSNAFGTGSAAGLWTVLTGAPQIAPVIIGSAYGNIAIRGIDVFQVVQPNAGASMFGFPSGGFPASAGGGTPTNWLANFTLGGPAQRVGYSGVPLDADKPTTAVVYVHRTTAAPGGSTPIEVTLNVYRNGLKLGSLVKTTTNPPNTGARFVPMNDRDNVASGVHFPLPAYLVNGDFDIEARIGFPMGELLKGRRECDDQAPCNPDNTFRVDRVPSAHLMSLTIVGVRLLGRNQTTLPDAYSVLTRARQVFPGGERMIVGTVASLDVGDETNYSFADHQCTDIKFKSVRSCRQHYVANRLARWRADDPVAQGLPFYHATVGVHEYNTDNGAGREPGWTEAGEDFSTFSKGDGQPLFFVNAGSANRPFTATAHELGHVFSAPHAERGPACGGDSNGQVGEDWPPDNSGRLQGVMFDHTSAKPVDPIIDGTGTVYDFMSYCTQFENRAWISARNWNRAYQVLQGLEQRLNQKVLMLRQAGAGDGFAVGIIGPEGGVITRVVPPDGADNVPPADPASGVRLRSLDASGRVLKDVGVKVLRSTEEPDGGTFTGPVARNAATVELLRDGAVVHTFKRSAPPRVKLLSQRGLKVRWSASDPDSKPLTASVEYAPDGRTWRTVFEGPNRGRASLRERDLVGSKRARVRVTVSDGFAEASATSAPFEVKGAPATVQIVSAGPAVAGQPVKLSGRALDASQRPLRPTWFAGRKRLGSGENLTVRLPAGRVVLRLGAGGGEARRTLRVAPVPLQLEDVTAPARVARGVRAMTVRIRVSAATTLVAGGRTQRLRAGTTRVTVRLPARPATGVLRVPLRVGDIRTELTVLRA